MALDIRIVLLFRAHHEFVHRFDTIVSEVLSDFCLNLLSSLRSDRELGLLIARLVILLSWLGLCSVIPIILILIDDLDHSVVYYRDSPCEAKVVLVLSFDPLFFAFAKVKRDFRSPFFVQSTVLNPIRIKGERHEVRRPSRL